MVPKDKIIYTAGPMTGLPQFNIPAFQRVARRLRKEGYTVVSPVELDSDAIRQEALASPDGAMPATGKIGGETWGQILARDVRVIADHVDCIVVLPNWERSRGARLEVFVALLCKKPIYLDAHYAESGSGDPDGMTIALVPISTHRVISEIMLSFLC